MAFIKSIGTSQDAPACAVIPSNSRLIPLAGTKPRQLRDISMDALMLTHEAQATAARGPMPKTAEDILAPGAIGLNLLAGPADTFAGEHCECCSDIEASILRFPWRSHLSYDVDCHLVPTIENVIYCLEHDLRLRPIPGQPHMDAACRAIQILQGDLASNGYAMRRLLGDAEHYTRLLILSYWRDARKGLDEIQRSLEIATHYTDGPPIDQGKLQQLASLLDRHGRNTLDIPGVMNAADVDAMLAGMGAQ